MVSGCVLDDPVGPLKDNVNLNSKYFFNNREIPKNNVLQSSK